MTTAAPLPLATAPSEGRASRAAPLPSASYTTSRDTTGSSPLRTCDPGPGRSGRPAVERGETVSPLYSRPQRRLKARLRSQFPAELRTPRFVRDFVLASNPRSRAGAAARPGVGRWETVNSAHSRQPRLSACRRSRRSPELIITRFVRGLCLVSSPVRHFTREAWRTLRELVRNGSRQRPVTIHLLFAKKAELFDVSPICACFVSPAGLWSRTATCIRRSARSGDPRSLDRADGPGYEPQGKGRNG